jgi:hypothetical protein
MPKQSTNSRAATASEIAVLIRIHKAAAALGDEGLGKAVEAELKAKYGLDMSCFITSHTQSEEGAKR